MYVVNMAGQDSEYLTVTRVFGNFNLSFLCNNVITFRDV